MKYLLNEGFLNGDCLTVTGRTLKENLRDVPELKFENQNIVFPLSKPIRPAGPMVILKGKYFARRLCCQGFWVEGDRNHWTRPSL